MSQNEALLINKYVERYESNERDMENLNFKADLTEDRMKAFIVAVKSALSLGKDIEELDEDFSAIVEDVEWDWDGMVDEQTTYDYLIINYSNDSVAANDKKLDMAYCVYVLDQFKGERDASIDYAEYEEAVKKSIANVLAELEELYEKANINISDYNSYIPALHIKKLSGVSYYTNLSGSLYKIIAVMVGFIIPAVIAIAYETMKKYAAYSKKEEDEDSGDDGESPGEEEETDETADAASEDAPEEESESSVTEEETALVK